MRQIEYIAVDNIAENDYIYIHFDGKIFNGNEYPFELRSGVANRDILVGQYVDFKEGTETRDVRPKPLMPALEELVGW